MSRGTIFYIGLFELPDKNAAAHRVIGNAKVWKRLGYKVVLVSKSNNHLNSEIEKTSYFDFDAWEIPIAKNKNQIFKSMYTISPIKDIIEKYDDVKILVTYNYPAIASLRLINYCNRNAIKTIADVTEWYSVKGRSILYKVFKGLDSSLRMNYVLRKNDGLIVISKYLENHYRSQKNLVCIPPLIDINDNKWNGTTRNFNKITFVYAGSPSKSKERLDVVVKVFNNLCELYPIKLIIVGITKNEYEKIYGDLDKRKMQINKEELIFVGRISHLRSLEYVKSSNYSIIVREKSRLTDAGFPTKFVESISCSTPVIATDTSDIANYISSGKNGFIVTIDDLNDHLENIIKQSIDIKVEKELFHFEKYLTVYQNFIDNILED